MQSREWREGHGEELGSWKWERGMGSGGSVCCLLLCSSLCSVQLALLVFSSSGNAMGHIRMIRSGGLHCCSNAIR